MLKQLIASAILGMSLVNGASAIEPERREVTVVSGRVWDGFTFHEMFLPSQAAALHLISGQDSAISFVRTEEYYWPLSRQVYVDFEKKRDDVPGVLQVIKDGKAIADVKPTPYSIEYPQGAINGNGHLLWGDDALQAFNSYQAEEQSFARRYAEAEMQNTEYERKLVASGAARVRGEPAEVIEPPPPLPRPNLRLVTKPTVAYQLALDAGHYEMALRLNGVTVPDTRRQVDVIDLVGRSTVVGDVVPEEKWTRPIATNADTSRIFARPGSTFYLTLAAADRFKETEYLPVISPQVDTVQGRDTWIRRKTSEIDRLNVRFSEQKDEVQRTRLKVEQTQTSGFGYSIRPAKNGEKEDLMAFAISVPATDAITRGEVFSPGPKPVFTREIVVVQPRQAGLALALVFLPMIGWLGTRLRRSTRGI